MTKLYIIIALLSFVLVGCANTEKETIQYIEQIHPTMSLRDKQWIPDPGYRGDDILFRDSLGNIWFLRVHTNTIDETKITYSELLFAVSDSTVGVAK